MIFQLADELEHLQRIEAEIGEQFAVERRVDGAAADTLEDVDGFVVKAVEGRRRTPGNGVRARRIGSLGQASKCNTNPTGRATARADCR